MEHKDPVSLQCQLYCTSKHVVMMWWDDLISFGETVIQDITRGTPSELPQKALQTWNVNWGPRGDEKHVSTVDPQSLL